MIKPLSRSIRDRPVGPKRRVALVTSLNELCITFDVENGVLLTGKRRVRQVLGSCGGTHRDLESSLTYSFAKALVCFEDRIFDLTRKGSLEDQAASLAACLG